MTDYVKTVNHPELSALIEERETVRKRIVELCDNPNSSDLQIGLLERKQQSIIAEIEAYCSPHKWGEEYWGYIMCDVCGKQRSTKHC